MKKKNMSSLTILNTLHRDLLRLPQFRFNPGVTEYVDIRGLANSLFQHLNHQFRNGVNDEAFVVLLKCCFATLPHFEFNFTFLRLKFSILLSILTWAFRHSPSVLEVFIGEILMSNALRNHLALLGSQHSYTIQEMLSCHFLLSVRDLSTPNGYAHYLGWNNEVENATPHLNLTVALRLLRSHMVFSVPHLIQAHMLVLASRCTSIQTKKGCEASDVETMSACTLGFELSVDYYIKYLSELSIFDNLREGSGQSCIWGDKLSFLAHVEPATSNRLSYMTDLLLDLGVSLEYQDLHFRTAEDMVNNCYAYIKEHDSILDEKFRDEICLIMRWIIVKIVSLSGQDVVRKVSSNIQQKECCLAAAMKLIGSSLLQMLMYLRKIGCPNTKKVTTVENIDPNNFDLLSHIVNFRKFETNHLVQTILLDENGINSDHDKELKLMLVHFGSLLLWSFERRLDILWNNCLFLMMILVNFLAFRKDSWDEFIPLIATQKQFDDFPRSPKELPEGLAIRRTTKEIALKFQNIQMLYRRDHDHVLSNEGLRETTRKLQSVEVQRPTSNTSPSQILGMDARQTGGSELETCNGESFIKCLPGCQKSDCDDLADFIECKKGKDYSSWLNSKKTFRKWKHQRRNLKKTPPKNENEFLKNVWHW